MIRDFNKLYAVSDLHLGGPPERQVFRESAALGWLINQATTDPIGRVALLVNGDVVDFLADGEEAKEFNLSPEAFLRKLDEPGSPLGPIFVALRAFVAKPDRYLILQIGNHDIELALPAARAVLHDLVGAKDKPTQDRVFVESSGDGWSCRVGSQVVLAVHGNACDPWNRVDHATLAEMVRALERGQRPHVLPETNAGTLLVVNVLNALKADYPFVDLLKPEGPSLLAVLKSVNARQNTRGLLKALAIRASKGDLRELLSAEEERDGAPISGPTGQILEFLAATEPPAAGPRDALRRAERDASEGKSPRALADDEDEMLGEILDSGRVSLQRLQAGIERLRGVPDEVTLRKALAKWLADDESFHVDALSNIDQCIVRSAGPSVDILLAGHTHMARRRDVNLGALVYINTGTWMRVLKLNNTPYLRSDGEFEKFMVAVRARTLQALDDLKIDPRSRPVAIVSASGALLFSVQDHGASFQLKPLAE